MDLPGFLPLLFTRLLLASAPLDSPPEVLFVQTGALGVFAWLLYRFFRSAVSAHALSAQRAIDAYEQVAAAHAKRADDWKSAYDAQVARVDERDAQVAHMLSAIGAATNKSTPTGGA